MDSEKQAKMIKNNIPITADQSFEAGVRSFNIENLGQLRKFSQLSMIPVTKLVNMACFNITAFFDENTLSTAYRAIKKKAYHLDPDDPEMELVLIRMAVDSFGQLFLDGGNSTFEKCLNGVDTLKKLGMDISIEKFIAKAIERSVRDPNFVNELLNKSSED